MRAGRLAGIFPACSSATTDASRHRSGLPRLLYRFHMIKLTAEIVVDCPGHRTHAWPQPWDRGEGQQSSDLDAELSHFALCHSQLSAALGSLLVFLAAVSSPGHQMR